MTGWMDRYRERWTSKGNKKIPKRVLNFIAKEKGIAEKSISIVD
jgi:hypothetical protein